MFRHLPRVLVVDDLPDSAVSMSALLNLCGFKSEAQTSGKGALACAARNRPDIVLADLRMPRMDGFEFIRHFREIDGCCRTPVVVISGFRIATSRVQARVFGIDHFFAKPVEINALMKVMRDLLDMPLTRIRDEVEFTDETWDERFVLAVR